MAHNGQLVNALSLRSTLDAARRVLGCLLVRDLPEGRLVGRIVETEAYLPNDPACHAVRELPDGGAIHKQTARNAPMFGPPGLAYVYFTYGNHFMLNIATEEDGIPGAVLIRALEPLEGVEWMIHRRGMADTRNLTNGPGKLTRAFGINAALNGHDLSQPPLQLIPEEPIPDARIVATTRIGISKATECPWRFYLRDNPWVSRR